MTRRRAVRISAGTLKGTPVVVPARVRPTSARVREALMDGWQRRLAGAAVLDLFAGSGAVGLEAIARGAATLLGLEAQPEVLEALRASYGRLAPDRAEGRRASLPADLVRAARGRRFDLVFADPPYAFDRFGELLAACAGVLAAGGELAIEHAARNAPPDAGGGLACARRRGYGESQLSFYAPVEGGDGRG